MILHPGILAQLVGAVIVVLMLTAAALVGIQILRHWDYSSSSEEQLVLERKTYLVSTLVSYALGFVVLSGALFVYTVDDIHGLFVGAMCAVGSLNANPVGWNVLWLKMLSFFTAGIWLALNRLDQQAENFPFIRLKYWLLLGILPLTVLDLLFSAGYFLGLEPEIITSCCGSLFGSPETSIATELAGLPIGPMMWSFYLTFAALALTGILSLLRRGGWRYVFSGLSLVFFFLSLGAIVSFISLYIYELPTHHCPFDIVQKEYNFIGYPLYAALFCGGLFGVLPGLFGPLHRYGQVSEALSISERRWICLSLGALGCFVLLASWPVAFGNLTLKGYAF